MIKLILLPSKISFIFFNTIKNLSWPTTVARRIFRRSFSKLSIIFKRVTCFRISASYACCIWFVWSILRAHQEISGKTTDFSCSFLIFWYSDILPTGALILCYTPVASGLFGLFGLLTMEREYLGPGEVFCLVSTGCPLSSY